MQEQYDAARAGFAALEKDPIVKTQPDMGDFAAYKVFLCDLFGGHQAQAKKELDVFNDIMGNPSYYFCNAAWDLVSKRTSMAPATGSSPPPASIVRKKYLLCAEPAGPGLSADSRPRRRRHAAQRRRQACGSREIIRRGLNRIRRPDYWLSGPAPATGRIPHQEHSQRDCQPPPEGHRQSGPPRPAPRFNSPQLQARVFDQPDFAAGNVFVDENRRRLPAAAVRSGAPLFCAPASGRGCSGCYACRGHFRR